MIPDDESLLSAISTESSAAEEHEAVELAPSRRSARLAETLRGLVGVQRSVAALSRPAPADAAPEVMRRARRTTSRSVLRALEPSRAPHPLGGGQAWRPPRCSAHPGRFGRSAARPPCRTAPLDPSGQYRSPAAVPPTTGKRLPASGRSRWPIELIPRPAKQIDADRATRR